MMIVMVAQDFTLGVCHLGQGHVILRKYLADMEGN